MERPHKNSLYKRHIKFNNFQAFLKAAPHLLPLGSKAIQKLACRFCISPELLIYQMNPDETCGGGWIWN